MWLIVKRSTKANAFNGLGPKKTIDLWYFNRKTLRWGIAVLAHEVGHFRKTYFAGINNVKLGQYYTFLNLYELQ